MTEIWIVHTSRGERLDLEKSDGEIYLTEAEAEAAACALGSPWKVTRALVVSADGQDGRLLAAAPEMLELLRKLAVGYIDYDEEDGQRIDDFIDFTHQAQALLAGIEGG